MNGIRSNNAESSCRTIRTLTKGDSVVRVFVITITGIPRLCVWMISVCIILGIWHCLLRLNPRPIYQLVVSSFSRAVVALPTVTMTKTYATFVCPDCDD